MTVCALQVNRDSEHVMSVSKVFDDLDPVLDDKGGLKNSDAAIEELIRLMDAVENEDFDIQLCYLLVLAETKTAQILIAFLNKGGWPTLARWLNGYIEQKHFVGIRQLVKTYRALPVTTQILKKPIETGKMPGKMIRSLRKHDDEVIKALSTEVFESWNTIISNDEKARKEKKALKANKEKKEAKEKGQVKLVDNMIGNMFDAAQDEKKKAKVDEKKRKEAKKRRREEEEKKNSLLNNIMNLMPGQADGAPTSKVAALAPKTSTSPEPVLEKRPRKPGAKTVRWTDQASARPLEMVREIEIDPLERANVNSAEFKRQLELDSFREGAHLHSDTQMKVFHDPNIGDTKPKRQWRSPRKISNNIPIQAQKNTENFSVNSEEKTKADERTKVTLQRLYPSNAIPDSPTEPDIRAPVSSGDKVKIIPQRTDESDSQQMIKQEEPPVVDLSNVNLNFDLNTIRAAVSSATTQQSHSSRISPANNSRYSTSPPMEHNRFGGSRGPHDPTPPRRHSPGHSHNRFEPYPDRRHSPGRGQFVDHRQNFNGGQRHYDDRQRGNDNFRRGPSPPFNQRHPLGHGDHRGYRESPPPRDNGRGDWSHNHQRSRSPPRPYIRDYRR